MSYPNRNPNPNRHTTTPAHFDRDTWIMVIIIGVLILLIGALADTCHADGDTMALCRIGATCTSWVIADAPPQVVAVMMYWEFLDPAPDVQDWQPWPTANGGILETRALGIAVWSPEGVPFVVRLIGQQYQTWLPLVTP